MKKNISLFRLCFASHCIPQPTLAVALKMQDQPLGKRWPQRNGEF
jgi:hypothetical protein